MKKIIYIFSAALLCLVSCTREMNPEQIYRTTSIAPKEGDRALVTFYVTVAETPLVSTQTRASHHMGEQPDDPTTEAIEGIENGDLYVAVFGKGSNGLGGQLQHFLKATLMKDPTKPGPGIGIDPPIAHDLTDETDPTKTYRYAYQVLLPVSEDALVLDFFAGAYDANGVLYSLDNPLPVAYEKDVMPLLRSINGNAAYWQRVEIPAVRPKVIIVDGKEQYAMAQIFDEDGVPIFQEATEYEAEVIPQLKDIRLVRNFAKVTFTVPTNDQGEGIADFELKGFYLVDTPVTGTVAPFSGSTGYANAYTTTTDAAAIMASYKGYIVSTALTAGIDGKSFKDPGTFEYMYERPVPDLNRPLGETGAILWVKWKNIPAVPSDLRGQERYYKVGFVDKDGSVPILRNIVYNFQISAINADSHYAEPADAYSHSFLGDISANIATSMLDEITNNKSLIKVSEMSKTFIGEGGEDKAVDINFWFYPDVQNHPTDVRVINGVTYQGQTVTIQVVLEDVSGHQHAIDSWSISTSADMGTVHVVPSSSVVGSVKKSKIKILGQWGTQRALYREVEFTVMEKQAFAKGDIVCSVTPLASDEANQDVTVTIALPDELPRDVFPLQIKIEPQNNGLRSVPVTIEGKKISALPVKYGKSAFDANKNNYYFVKTITFDDYAKLVDGVYKYTNEFPCYFKTRLSTGNATDIKINDLDEEYFVESKVTLQ